MYVVVSKWEFDPEHEAEVQASAAKMMQTFSAWPEIKFAYNVRAGENYVLAVMGYESQAAHQRLIADPNGPFEKALSEHDMEQHARWVWSERGEMDDSARTGI